MQLSGKIIKILPLQKGQGKNGEWVKQEFVIETQDQYPKKICIGTFGTMASNMDSYKVGDVVNAHINIESREYNEKWYTEVKAWKMEKTSSSTASTEESIPADTTTFTPVQSTGFTDEESDLPFRKG